MVTPRTLAYRLAHRLRQVWWRARRPIAVGVRAVVCDGEGRVLLLRHTYGRRQQWYLPGGSVRRGESVREGALREAREETGVEVVDPDAVTMLGLYLNCREGKTDHIAVFVLPAGSWRREDRSSPEIAMAAFHPLDALPEGTSRGSRRRLAELAGEVPVSEQW